MKHTEMACRLRDNAVTHIDEVTRRQVTIEMGEHSHIQGGPKKTGPV